MWDRLRVIHAMVCRFWGTVPGALKNHLNSEELARITIASLTAGGGLFGLIEALALNVGTIFPGSADAALAMAVLTMILDGRRRLGQGREPAFQPQQQHPTRWHTPGGGN